MRIRKLMAATMAVCLLETSIVMPSSQVEAAETITTTYYENGFALTIVETVGNTVPDSVIEKQKYIYFNQYPKMIERLNPSRPRSVTFVYDPDYDGVAYTSGTTIVYAVDYMNSHPADVDCATHELSHVAQGGYKNYGSSLIATALCEGVADYMRSIYGLYNKDSNWGMQDYKPSYSYTDSYGVTANFITWVMLNKDSRLLYELNTTMHKGTYTDDLWVQLTGETVDELWADYAADANVYHMNFASNKEETFGITSGDTYVISSAETGKALSVDNNSSDNLANVNQKTYVEGNESQQWVLNYIGDGLYNILNKKSGKALDVNNADSVNGTNIQQYEWNQSDAQKWAIVEQGGNYTLFPVCGNGKGVADLSGSSHNENANIQLYEWNKSNAQRFNINNINDTNNTDYNLYGLNKIEAEAFVTCSPDVGVAIDEDSDRSGGANIGGVAGKGTWTMYHGVIFEDDAVAMEITYCNPGGESYVNVYVDSMNSTPVGKIIIPNNSSNWTTYSTVRGSLTTPINAGTHEIYLEFKNNSLSGYAQNCDYFKFFADETPVYDAFAKVEAEKFDIKSSGIVIDTNSSRSNGSNIGGVTNNSYIGFKKLKFEQEAKSIAINYAAQESWASGRIEVYVDSMDGNLAGSYTISTTGSGWDNYVNGKCNLTYAIPAGIHSVYLKFVNDGATAYVANVDYIAFSDKVMNDVVLSDNVSVAGFQISQTSGGLRAVYSVEPIINGKTVTEFGAVYSLSKYVNSEDEVCVGSTNSLVFSHTATNNAILPRKVTDSPTSTDYAITMINNGTTKDAFEAQYGVRAFAKLSDGTYVYSEIEYYTIYNVASKLYNGVLMGNYNAHQNLYNNILMVVDPNYKEVDYNFNNIFVKP